MEQQVDAAHPKGKWKASVKERDFQKSRGSIAAQLRAGSNQAAEQLVELYYEQIYIFIRRLGHSSQVSEDLTQESFLQAWRNIGQLKDDAALKGWIYRIAGNVSRLYWRKNEKTKNVVSTEKLEISDRNQGEDKLGGFEELERLKTAIDMLPMKQKEAVILHYLQHLTIIETAQAVGVRKGTLKSRISRALRNLKKQIE